MAEDPISDPDISSLSSSPSASKERRTVYEPSLLLQRTRRRAPRWVVIPLLLLILSGAFYLVLGGGHHRRFVASAGGLVMASDAGSPGTPHLWRAALDGSATRRLSLGVLPETQPAFSQDGSQVAFISPINSNPQVFVIDADGQNSQQITRNAGAKQQPRFSPSDNNMLAYVSGGAVSTVGIVSGDSSRLLPPAPDPSQVQQSDTLLNSPAVIIGDYHWAPGTDSSSQALAAREETADVQALVVLPSLGGKARDTQSDRPNSPPLAAATAVTTGWSPSGSLLAAALLGVRGLPPGRFLSAIVLFDRDGNPAGQKPLAVITNIGTGPQFPVFSPDGSQILFELWQQPDLAHAHCLGLYVTAIDNTSPPREIARGDAEGALWTPNGQSVLFLRQRSSNAGHDLWRVGADGAGLTRLSDGTADISGFQISPQSKSSP